MPDGVSRRAQIDLETVRALLLVNGGGAVALLSVFSPILNKDGYEPLAKAILIGVIILMVGLASAIIHNHLRRHCSLMYERHHMRPPRGFFLGFQLWAPRVCCASTVCLWISVITFVSAGSFVAYTGIVTLSQVQSQKIKTTPLITRT